MPSPVQTTTPHVHTLDAERHAAFLASGPADPLTGVPFREGSEVVACANCRAIFDRDIWEAMGEKHCGQSETLAVLPTQAPPPRAPSHPYLADPRGPDTRRRQGTLVAIVAAVGLAAVLAAFVLLGQPDRPDPDADIAALVEEANTPAPLGAIPVGMGTVSGRLGAASTSLPDGRLADSYLFLADEEGPFSFSVESEFEPVLEVETPDGRRVPASRDGRGLASVTGLAGLGRYLVTVSGRSPDDVGTYTLTLGRMQARIPVFVDGEAASGVLGGRGAVRREGYYEIVLPFESSGGQSLVAEVVSTAFSPRLRVRGPEGAIPFVVVDEGEGRLAVLFDTEAGGPHQVLLTTDEPGQSGPFRFWLSRAEGERAPSAFPDADRDPEPRPEPSPEPRATPTPAPETPPAPRAAPAPRPAPPPAPTPRAEPAPRTPPAPAPRPSGRVAFEVRDLGRSARQAPLPENPGHSGSGSYRVVVAADGRVVDAFVAQPSGSAVADANALRALRRWQFAAAPNGSPTQVGLVLFRFEAR